MLNLNLSSLSCLSIIATVSITIVTSAVILCLGHAEENVNPMGLCAVALLSMGGVGLVVVWGGGGILHMPLIPHILSLGYIYLDQCTGCGHDWDPPLEIC